MKLKSAAAFLAALALSGCAAAPPEQPVTKVTDARTRTVPYAYRPGEGIVESIARVEAADTAAAGGTAGRFLEGVAYRLAVRMEDGTLQTVLQDSPRFAIGDRVRLTEDGRVIRL